MKKTFLLTSPLHKPARVVEQLKSEIRKYIKRERAKPRPEGVDFWDFDCQVGQGEGSPAKKHVEEVIPAINEAALNACPSVYIQILAVPGHRQKKLI